LLLQQKGMPSTVLVTERFVNLANSTMKGRGMPGAPMVVLPRSELTEYTDKAAVESILEEAMSTVVGQLAKKGAPA
jgi:hypothetical protein